MNRNPIRFAACAAVLLLTGAACNSGEEDDSGATVTIKLIAFAPTEVRVAAGDAVTWRQDDVASHTVTSGRVEQRGGTATATPDGRFDSGNITKGQTFDFSFAEPGAYPFFCAIHPATMTGVVTVT